MKDEDIHTAIDTSGYVESDIFRNVVTNADLVLFDLKLYASKKHKEYTGVSNHKIIENFYQLSDNSVAVYVRIPLIPKITDTEENLFALKELLLQNRSIRRLDLLPYNELADSKYKRLDINHEIAGLKTQNEIQLNQIKSIFEDVPFEITLRG